jgi:hypothetical protein
MNRSLLCALAALVATVALSGSRAFAQLDVYNNQGNPGFTAVGFSGTPTMWDDLDLTQGGLLSEISFIADPPSGNGTFASGVIDLRYFDTTFNRPQGAALATIPFSGNFAIDPLDPFGERLVIELTNLESMGINLPTAGKIGAGIRFNNSGWFFPDFGAPEIGSSPSGNWLNTSSSLRQDVTGLPWRVAIAPPTPEGPGVGSYTLFETSLPTANDPNSNGGTGAGSDFFTGVSFRVERPTKLSQVGAWMDGSGTIFAAIVNIGSGIYNPPNPHDLSGSNVLATSLIDLDSYDYSFGGGDVTADFDLTLQPGNYAVVFGAGKFGADANGDGLIRSSHLPNGDWDEFSLRQSDGFYFFQNGAKRIFAMADSVDGTAQIRPSFDTQVEVTRDDFYDDIVNVNVHDGEGALSAFLPSTTTTPDKLPLLEFSLEDVPANREVRSATLEIDVVGATLSSQYSLFGYAGDGAASLSDAFASRKLIGELTLTGVGLKTIHLEASYIAELVANGVSHLGLVIEPKGTGNFSFASLEGGQTSEPALLTINLGPAVLAGDYNNDGAVDAADYTVWRDMLGQDGAALPADGDGNGAISQADYNMWRNNYGTTAPAAEAGSVVPEPTAITLLAIALTASGVGRIKAHAFDPS